GRGGGGAGRPLLERMVDVAYKPVERAYMATLAWVMRRRWVVVVASLVALVLTAPLMQLVPKNFLPDSDEAQFAVNVRAPEGTSLEQTALIGERIAREMRRMEGVTQTVVTVGDDPQKT